MWLKSLKVSYYPPFPQNKRDPNVLSFSRRSSQIMFSGSECSDFRTTCFRVDLAPYRKYTCPLRFLCLPIELSAFTWFTQTQSDTTWSDPPTWNIFCVYINHWAMKLSHTIKKWILLTFQLFSMETGVFTFGGLFISKNKNTKETYF